MKCENFKYLINDMKINGIDKEHYSFVFKGFTFDVVLSIVSTGYEILVAIHSRNWGCALEMNKYFCVEMPDISYFELRDILQLNASKDKFYSSVFLTLLSTKAPHQSNRKGVSYNELRNYLPYRKVDEANKIYFCGWNTHISDGRNARNFDKTEFFLGKNVADYCRKHNISSMWSDVPRDEKKYINPWE